jgi:aryl-alcohol dehydrogenase
MPTPAHAAVFRQPGAPPVIEPVVLDDPRAGELVVRLVGVGVCHTDMVLRDGHLPTPFPVVLGHEGSGVVEAVGPDVTSLVPGDHVVLSFDSCGHCPSCHDHAPAYCHDWFAHNFGGSRADGSTALATPDGAPIHSHVFGQSSFATHALVHARNAVKVAADLPLELLGPLGCGIQTGAGAVLNELRPRPGASVAVIGTGAVGLSAIMACGIAGAGVVAAIDINPARVALAQELGATHGFDARSGSLADHARAAGLPQGFDCVIDTTGRPDVVNAALPALAPRGQMALVGAYGPGDIAADATFLMSGGRVIRGVVEGGADPQAFIPELIAQYRAGRFPFDRLVRYFAFADIAEAIAQGETGQVIKPVLRMG